MDNKGTYAMFVLKLIAHDLRERNVSNGVSVSRFFGVSETLADDLMKELDTDRNEDDEELLIETSPEEDDDVPPEMIPQEECAMDCDCPPEDFPEDFEASINC